jgi:hypothetical protein
MATLLDIAYIVLVLLVAVAGTGFVFVTTGGEGGRRWQRWLVVALVAVFLVVMGGALVV